jgi:hypothetical protein
MSIVAFAAWLFVFIVFAPLVLLFVRIFLPLILGTIIAALYVAPIVLILIVAGVIIGSGWQQLPARYPDSDTLNRLYYSDPIFHQPQAKLAETPAPRAELVNPISITGQPSAGPIPVTSQP